MKNNPEDNDERMCGVREFDVMPAVKKKSISGEGHPFRGYYICKLLFFIHGEEIDL
jgi:hypothetical protein